MSATPPAGRLVALLDACAEFTGRAVAWLTLVMAVVTTVVVVLRYCFGIGSIALQESAIYMHAAVFLLGAAYTLKHDGHVRVDIFYRRLSPTAQAWVNCLGTIVFLWPLCGFIGFASWDFVAASWRIREVSPEPGGLPALFVLKSLIPLFAALLALQGLAEVLRHLAVLMYPGRES